jgi:hypothetical protein
MDTAPRAIGASEVDDVAHDFRVDGDKHGDESEQILTVYRLNTRHAANPGRPHDHA